jgi:cell wall-associated NlpC family hydrolase
MRIPPRTPGQSLRRVATALVACLAAAASGAFAAPDAATDPVPELLADKGLPETAAPAPEPRAGAPGMLDQVRDRTTEMAIAALDFVGVRYRRGGVSAESGFDCSGFTRHVFEMSLGMVLPRRADEQAAAPGLVAVKREELQPGDLVFFNTLKHTFSHVGIYIGANRFVHAPHSGASVRTDDMSFAFWAKRFTGARRIVTTAAVEPTSVGPAASTDAAGS